MCPQAASQHAAALQQVAEACPELVSLALVKWGLLLEPASLQPLSRLSHLRRLHLSASALVLGSPAALPQLPQLRSLRLACRAVRGAGERSAMPCHETLSLDAALDACHEAPPGCQSLHARCGFCLPGGAPPCPSALSPCHKATPCP